MTVKMINKAPANEPERLHVTQLTAPGTVSPICPAGLDPVSLVTVAEAISMEWKHISTVYIFFLFFASNAIHSSPYKPLTTESL